MRGDQIRDVWASNLDEEFAQVRNLISQYPYVSMVSILDDRSRANEQDTEFPGVVARPIGKFETSNEYHYQTLRCNVDLLKMIQVGLTLTDENGNSPPGGGTWQFNFKFDLAYIRLSPFLNIAPIHMLKTRSTCFLIQQGLTFHRVWITALTRVNSASY
jgi:hypothetical protein